VTELEIEEQPADVGHVERTPIGVGSMITFDDVTTSRPSATSPS
jgi:hypothetical protein